MMSLNRPEPPLMRQVSDLLSMDRTTLTAVLKPLARRGLVVVLQDAMDRRGRRLELTQAGLNVLVAAVPAWNATQAEVTGQLASADRLRSDLVALG